MAAILDISWHLNGFYTIQKMRGKGQGQDPSARFSMSCSDFCLKKRQNKAAFPNFYQKDVV